MLIRSQNKKCIINLDNIDTIEGTDGEIVYFNGGTETRGILGNYSTDEKIINVLDMIQKKYLEENYMPLLANYGFVKNNIFQMPQDDEITIQEGKNND